MAGNVGLEDNPSIPKLMDFLRTAFRPQHFDEVQEILVKREEKWKVEMERLKEENDVLRLYKISIGAENDELKKLIYLVNRDRIALRERERRLLEEMPNGTEFGVAEVTQVILKIIELENEKSAAEAAAAQWKNKYNGLEVRLSRLERDALLLGLEPPVVNNSEAALGENGTAPENGSCEIPRVKIERDVADCSGTVPENGNSSFAHVKVEVDEPDFNENTCPVGTSTCHSPKADTDNSQAAGCNGTVHENGNSSFTRVKIEVDESDFNENTRPGGAPTCHSPNADMDHSQAAGGKGHEHRVFIEINDSDDDSDLGPILPQKQTPYEKSTQASQSKLMDVESASVTLKRKQDSEAKNCCTDNNTQSRKRVCLQEQMAVNKTSLSNMSKWRLDDFEDIDSPSDSDSDNSVDEFTSGVKKYRKWNDEWEMGLALEKDPELCMDAVCALYRQEILPMGLTCSKHRGFILSDALSSRGIELAKFLINGDKQGKRMKSVMELIEHDENGVADCKKIVSRYEHRMQLFDIYKNQKDPFFPS